MILIVLLFYSELICINLLNAHAFNLTILHVNDLHSHFAQINTYGNTCDESTMKSGKCFGGVARNIYKAREIMNNTKNTLFLNGGDNFQGTVWYSLYKWEVVAKFVNMFKYDAMAIGNHEFDDGIDGFAPFLNATSSVTPTLCCNLDASNEPKLNNKFRKSLTLEIDNHTIGIIGYITPETSFLSVPGPTIKFNDEIECIKKEVDSLKKSGVKILIALGHSGYLKDMEIASQIPDLDVVVGAHSHSLLYTGPKPSVEDPVDKYPAVVSHGQHKTLVVQAYAFSKYLGRLDLEFNDDGDVINYAGNPILLEQSIPQDPLVLEEVEKYDKIIKSEYGKVIGRTAVFLQGGEDCEADECNMGNMLTDAMVDYYAKQRKVGTGWTDYAIAVANGGGIRTSIDEHPTNGSITIEHILAVFPFNNQMAILNLKGKQIREMLEFGVAGYDPRNPRGKFLQVSGIHVVYDLDKPDNQKVQTVKVRCADCRVPIYNYLNESSSYNVIMPEYMANGGDGYSLLMDTNIHRNITKDLDIEILNDYIKQRSPLTIGDEDRSVLKSTKFKL